ncbi:MAG: ATP-binding protein [Candidatus Cloacimonetes bacterium]|nr:ATP-binding protein [Candidatus Cloacimonadota bacterium]
MSAKKNQDQRIGLFDGLDQAVVNNFTKGLTRLKLRQGEAVQITGEGRQSLYLVNKGSLELSAEPAGGRDELAATVKAGEFCGEFSLLSDTAAGAFATALEDSELLEIPRDLFTQFSFSHPGVLLNVIRALSTRLRGTDNVFSDLMGDMIQRNRLTAIGMTAGKIIHDLKTPLTVISLTAQLLESLYPDAAEFTQSIIQQTKLVDELVREVLDYVKGTPSAIIPRQVDMNAFLQDLRETYGASLSGRNIALKIENRCAEPAYFDVERIRRVIINLLRNSSEAIEESGEISIVASLASNWLQISVIDNGPGIPESAAAQLFKPFFTYNKANGTGLGLPICQKLVQEHNGRIEFSPVQPHGSRFDIRLPQNLEQELSR